MELNLKDGVKSSLTGNASTATKLQTPRTISGVAFDGSANITLTASNVGAAASSHNHNGTYVYDKASCSGNMNDVAAYRNAMGMISLSGTDTTVNPNGKTGWHHFINMSYNTESTNMWQTQIANAAGTTDLWIRSRSGGTVTAGTNWAAPWTRILTGSNYKNVVTPSNIGAASATHTHSYLPLSGGTLTGAIVAVGESRFGSNYSDPATGISCGVKVSGNFAAGTVYEGGSNLASKYLGKTANAASATKLQTARSIGGTNFDGTSNIEITRMKNVSGRTSNANLATVGDGTMSLLLSTSSMTTGKPADDGYILNFNWDNTGGWTSQFHVPNNTSGKLQYRSMNAGTWGSWNSVYSTCNKPTAADIGAAASSHSHSYLPLSGGTMTGQLVLTNGGSSLRAKGITTGNDQVVGTGSGEIYFGNPKTQHIVEGTVAILSINGGWLQFKHESSKWKIFV